MRKVVAIISMAIVLACNPVKQVMKDPAKWEQVKEAVIRSGACVTDTTTTEEVTEEVVPKVSIIEVPMPCPDATIAKDGVVISVNSGVLQAKIPHKETIKTQKITNSIRDKSLENILKADIAQRDSAIKVYMSLYERSQLEVKTLKAEKSALKWKLFGVVLLAGVITFRKQILKLAI